MFTGLIEGTAIVDRVVREHPGVRLVVTAQGGVAAERVQVGDSIALNGCCLTVVAETGGCWEFQAGPETLAKTNLRSLQAGDIVNVERPLAANGRLGGHFVQGHVDGTGAVDQILPTGEWVTIWFRVPQRLAEDMVPKGSVAVDGVSLTVVDVEPERFSVALIPHTLNVTTLGRRQPGQLVNIETDILAKYVRKLLNK